MAPAALLGLPPYLTQHPRQLVHRHLHIIGVRAAGRRILVTMSPYSAGPRRHLATSPFSAPDPEPPAERFAVDDKVTHDKYGLGTVTAVENGIALIIDFGSHVQRILTPSTKLSKL
jgi:hypothetical protein